VLTAFPPVVGRQPRVLILGSMPSEASLAVGQYYGLERNAFWPIMGELFGAGRALPYGERLAVLKRHGVALWDVLRACERQGSLDSNIDLRTAEVNAFASFFRRYRTIKRVYFNGAKAADIYRRRVLPEVQLAAPYLTYERLPSTSPAMAALSFEQKLAAWSVLNATRDAA
jgi:hypoxanthine-DNA glycosylase